MPTSAFLQMIPAEHFFPMCKWVSLFAAIIQLSSPIPLPGIKQYWLHHRIFKVQSLILAGMDILEVFSALRNVRSFSY